MILCVLEMKEDDASVCFVDTKKLNDSPIEEAYKQALEDALKSPEKIGGSCSEVSLCFGKVPKQIEVSPPCRIEEAVTIFIV